MDAEAAFRTLRESWFINHIAYHAHEREWETDDAEAMRMAQNLRNKKAFDAQTERILRGESDAVCPQCVADLVK